MKKGIEQLAPSIPLGGLPRIECESEISLWSTCVLIIKHCFVWLTSPSYCFFLGPDQCLWRFQTNLSSTMFFWLGLPKQTWTALGTASGAPPKRVCWLINPLNYRHIAKEYKPSYVAPKITFTMQWVDPWVILLQETLPKNNSLFEGYPKPLM